MEERIINISSGRGPEECMLVVAKLLKEFLKEAKANNINAKVAQRIKGNMPNTLVSASVFIKGNNLDGFLKEWEGSVQWIGKSPFRKYHKRKNWFVEIFSFSNVKKIELKTDDIEFQTTKSSGPGGQHANKTESAVKAVHKESGLSVVVQESRSQFQNKKIAVKKLGELFANYRIQRMQELDSQQWNKKINVQRGSPTRIYVGDKFERKKIK